MAPDYTEILESPTRRIGFSGYNQAKSFYLRNICFYSKGDIKTLPQGATALDFGLCSPHQYR